MPYLHNLKKSNVNQVSFKDNGEGFKFASVQLRTRGHWSRDRSESILTVRIGRARRKHKLSNKTGEISAPGYHAVNWLKRSFRKRRDKNCRVADALGLCVLFHSCREGRNVSTCPAWKTNVPRWFSLADRTGGILSCVHPSARVFHPLPLSFPP